MVVSIHADNQYNSMFFRRSRAFPQDWAQYVVNSAREEYLVDWIKEEFSEALGIYRIMSPNLPSKPVYVASGHSVHVLFEGRWVSVDTLTEEEFEEIKATGEIHRIVCWR